MRRLVMCGLIGALLMAVAGCMATANADVVVREYLDLVVKDDLEKAYALLTAVAKADYPKDRYLADMAATEAELGALTSYKVTGQRMPGSTTASVNVTLTYTKYNATKQVPFVFGCFNERGQWRIANYK